MGTLQDPMIFGFVDTFAALMGVAQIDIYPRSRSIGTPALKALSSAPQLRSFESPWTIRLWQVSIRS